MKASGSAGWWLLFTAGFAGRTLAQSLSSTGFSNCGGNATVKVNYANVGFDSSSGTVTFNVSGSSAVQQKVKASLTVTAYGAQVYQNTFDPCSEATKVDELCPVPSGTFTASGSQKIPSQYLAQVPAAAYSIPNIDGNVTLKLTSADSGAEVGCVNSGVSNGKTLSLPAVTDVAVGIAAASFIVSGVTVIASAGLAGTTASCVGFASILGWFQTISVTGMMSVNYPSVYRSFSQDFGFSTGLISWEPMQTAIDKFRNSTGGNLTNNSFAALQNTTLVSTDGTSTSPGLSLRSYIHPRDIFLSASNVTGTDSNGNTNVTQLVFGISAFSEQVMVPQANVFMTALLILGIIAASITVGILLFKAVLELWSLFGSLSPKLEQFRKRYWMLLAKTLASLILLVYGVWVAWSIFQFTVGDSWAARALAAASLGLFTLILALVSARIIYISRRHARAYGDGSSGLYDDEAVWARYGVFYDAFRRQRWWMFMPLLALDFARGAVLAAGNGHGLAQTVAQLALEGLALVFLCATAPFATTAGNWINLGIQAVRTLSFACVLVFVEELGVAQTTQTVMGFALVVVQAVLAAVLAVLVVVNALVSCCRDNPHRLARMRGKNARDTLTSLDARNSFLARSAALGAVVNHGRMPSDGSQSAERLTVHAAAFGSARPVPQRGTYSYEDLDYRQPTLPRI